MLWSVEISQVGKGEVLEQLTVEAPNWQAALKQARDQRGEGNTLEGLSLEFLDEGCRAIDGAKALRYLVARSAESAQRTSKVQESGASGSRKAIERPSPSRRSLEDARPSTSAARPSATAGRPVTRKAAEPEPAPEPEPPPSEPDAATFELLSSRTTPGTSRMPLAHHERAFGLLEPVDDAELESFALARLAEVRAELVGAKAGNVVDIAIFQEPFDGRPTVAPVVTVRWCDWREIPEVKVDPYPDYEPDPAHDDVSAARGLRPARPESERPSRAIEPPPRQTAPSKPEPASIDDKLPTVEEPTRRKVLPKALPKAAPAKAQTPAPAPAAAEPAKAKPATQAKSAPTDESSDVAAGTPLTSKRPLGARSPLAARPSTSARAVAGPVAGSRPAGATLVAGGLDVKGDRAGAGEAGRERSDSAKVTGKATDGEDGDAEPPPARPSTRSVVTVEADAPSQRIVAASGGGFESSRRRGVAARPVESGGGRVLSREEKEARHTSARLRASTVPPPEARAGRRVDGDQLIAELFEALSDLAYQPDALEGAALVLAVALDKVPSEVGMVSLFDLDRREFVVVRQEGGKRSSLLLRAADASTLPAEAMRAKRAISVNERDDLDRRVDARWKDVGVELRSLLCAPVEMAGRTLGLLELANPRDADEFESGDENALAYIARQFAEFLDQRGVLLDPDAVLSAAEVNPRF